MITLNPENITSYSEYKKIINFWHIQQIPLTIRRRFNDDPTRNFAFDNKEKLKTQPRLGILLNTKHQIFKENKPCLNPTPRTVLKNDPIKHLIRKHLGDLYSKIMLKVKNIEKTKKPAIPPKRILDKCGSSKRELTKSHNGLKGNGHTYKKSVQYTDQIKRIAS